MQSLKYILYIIGLSSLIFLTHCKDEDDNPPEVDVLAEQLEQLMNGGSSWTLAPDGVLKDGLDVTTQFTGFTLTIGNKTYETTNALSGAWPSSGTWDFENDNPNRVLRDDGVSITVAFSGNTMILTFLGDGTSSGGRTSSVSGEYTFHLQSE